MPPIARLILADDHEIVRSGLRNALEMLPQVQIVTEVDDGLALFKALAMHTADCLLIDVAMPHFDPIADVTLIRYQYPTLKILVVSAHDDDLYVQGLMAAGVNGYHLKDQPLNDLRLALQRVLDGKKWISSRLLERLVAPGQPDTPPVTERQRHILALLHDGCDNQSIARQTGLSIKTVENHLTRIYRQLGVQSRLEAVNYIIKHPTILQDPHPRPFAPPTAKPIATDSTKPLIILVVDDNGRYRQQFSRMVQHVYPRAQVHEASDTAEAVQMAQQVRPQLLFVDVVLGEESGIHCTQQLKALPIPLRVVLMSAYPDREFHRLGLAAGAMAFLDKKDVDAAVLRHIISDIVPLERE